MPLVGCAALCQVDARIPLVLGYSSVYALGESEGLQLPSPMVPNGCNYAIWKGSLSKSSDCLQYQSFIFFLFAHRGHSFWNQSDS